MHFCALWHLTRKLLANILTFWAGKMKLGNCSTWQSKAEQANNAIYTRYHMWYYVVYICHIYLPLDPKQLDPHRAKLLSLLTSATLLLGQQRVEFMQLAVRLPNYVHFISCSGKEKANMLTHSHTHTCSHTRRSSHPSLGETSGISAVCVCVRHQGQFIVYLKLWTCETTSWKRWARGGGRGAGVHRGV